MSIEVFRSIFWALAILATLAAGLATLVGFLSRSARIFDLFSHFRVQYFVALVCSTLLFLVGSRPWLAALSAAFAAINLAVFLPLYIRPGPIKTDTNGGAGAQRTYRVLMANVLKKNPSFEKVRSLIWEVRPDFVVLIEVNQTWMDELGEVLAGLPHRKTTLREDNYGVSLHSRFPLVYSEERSFCEARVPSVIACLELEGRSLTLVATHPPPPKSGLEMQNRDQQLDQLGGFLAGQEGEKMVLGDLNITPWAPALKGMLKNAGLRESRLGFGVQPSWPTDRPSLRVPIDHVLVSSGIRVHRRTVGPNVGSDHFPVIVEFSFDHPLRRSHPNQSTQTHSNKGS